MPWYPHDSKSSCCAGLLAAISFKRKLPQPTCASCAALRSGRGRWAKEPPRISRAICLKTSVSPANVLRARFDQLGIRFLWGPTRPLRLWSFGQQLDSRQPQLPRPNGFYCDEQFHGCDLPTSLMARQGLRASSQRCAGPWHAFHIGKKLVELLGDGGPRRGIEMVLRQGECRNAARTAASLRCAWRTPASGGGISSTTRAALGTAGARSWRNRLLP